MYSFQDTFRKDALARLNSGMLDAQKIAEHMLEMAREIGNLNLRTGKAGADAFSSAARKLLDAGNPAEFLALAASVARPDFSAMHAYAEQLNGIATRHLGALPSFQPLRPQAPAAPDAPVSGDVAEAMESAAAALNEAPAAAPPATAPADAALAQSLVLTDTAPVLDVDKAAEKPAAQPEPAKEADAVAVARAALPAETAPPTVAIAKKTVASPAVLEAGVSQGKSRESRKPPKAALPPKGRSAKPLMTPPLKTKKPGM
jgi:phasin family protein